MQFYKNPGTKSEREQLKMMKQQGFEVSLVEPGNFGMKYALSAPYHLFFTRIQKSKETYNQTVFYNVS